jgi:hypothetical protein
MKRRDVKCRGGGGYNVCERWLYLALKFWSKIRKDDSRDEKFYFFKP